jgi:hypothetical protein
LRPMEYVMGFFYKWHIFHWYLISIFGIITNMNINF